MSDKYIQNIWLIKDISKKHKVNIFTEQKNADGRKELQV